MLDPYLVMINLSGLVITPIFEYIIFRYDFE